MFDRGSRTAWLASAAVIAMVPGLAQAQSAREVQMEARLSALEQSFSAMRGELEATRAENASLRTAATESQARNTALAATIEQVRTAPPPAQPDGFRSGATTIKLNGFIKANAIFSRYSDGDVATGALGKDFYLPQQIPIGGTREGNDYSGHAKQTRLWLTMATPVGGKMLKGHVEFDFQTSQGAQGSQRTTNGYNPALRRGFFSYGKWLIGQEWSNFQYVAALPESTDFVGPTEGTVFVRQMQLRYTTPLGKGLTFSVAAENPETASITPVSAGMIENDDDRIPDVTARLSYAGGFGEVTVAGLVRQLSVDNGAIGAKATGYGISAAGKLLFGADKRHDLRVMATWGKGIGRYVGLNLAPDAVFAGTAGSDLALVENFAAFAALKLGWTKTVRSTFMASVQTADYPALVPLAVNRKAWSLAGNLFWTPVKGFDVGIEYRHGERELLSGASGQIDRLEAAFKYSF